MTRKHFVEAARIVHNILDGNWTFIPPTFGDNPRYLQAEDDDKRAQYTRAVQTAEAFIALFSRANPRFNRDRFLKAGGLK